MNVLAKVKSDTRIVTVKDAVESGEVRVCADAKVASGRKRPSPPSPGGPIPK
jgi:hypothetical protein